MFSIIIRTASVAVGKFLRDSSGVRSSMPASSADCILFGIVEVISYLADVVLVSASSSSPAVGGTEVSL